MESVPTRGISPIVKFMATGGYSGYAPIAPGTVASLVCAVLAWYLLPHVTTQSSTIALAGMLISLVAFVVMAAWVAGRAEAVFGPDASTIVIDEFAGYLIAIALLPKSILVYVTAFVLFRVIDILKPFPARRLESLPGGVGIVMDDVVAGLYANVLIRIMLLVKGW